MERGKPTGRPAGGPPGSSSSAAAAAAAASTAKKMTAAAAALLVDRKPTAAPAPARAAPTAAAATPPTRPAARTRPAAPAGAPAAAAGTAAAPAAFAPKFVEAQTSKLHADIDALRAQRAQLESLLARSEYRLTAMGQVSRDLSRSSRRHRSQSVRSRGGVSEGGGDGDAGGSDDGSSSSGGGGSESDAHTVRTRQLDDAETVATARLDAQRAAAREAEAAFERAKAAAEAAAAALREERREERERAARQRSAGRGGSSGGGADGAPPPPGGGGRTIVQMAQAALSPLPQGFTAFKNISARFRSGELPALAYHVAVVRLFTNANAAAVAAHEAAAAGPGGGGSDGGAPPPLPPPPLDPAELPLRVFRRFFPKLVAVLPDPKQRSVLARLHGQWEEAQAAAEAAAETRARAAAAMGVALPPSAVLQLPQVVPGSAAARGALGSGGGGGAPSPADFPALAAQDPAALARHQLLQAMRSLQGARRFADAAAPPAAAAAAALAGRRAPTRDELFPALGSEQFLTAPRAPSRSRARRAVFRSLSLGRASARFRPVPFSALTALSLGGAGGGGGGGGGGEDGDGAFPALGAAALRPPAPSFAALPVRRRASLGGGEPGSALALDALPDDAQERPAPAFQLSVAQGLGRVLDSALHGGPRGGGALLIQSGGARAVHAHAPRARSLSVSAAPGAFRSGASVSGASVSASSIVGGASVARWSGVFGRQKGGGNDHLDDETRSLRVASTVRGGRGRGGGGSKERGGGYGGDDDEGAGDDGGDRATIRAGGWEGAGGRDAAATLPGHSHHPPASATSLFSSDFLRRRDIDRLAGSAGGGYGGSVAGAGGDAASPAARLDGGLRPQWARLVRMDPIAGVTYTYGAGRSVYDPGPPKRDRTAGGSDGDGRRSVSRRRK